MATIHINNDICIKCGRCARICPSGIFNQEKRNSTVYLQHPESCIICGHCVAVCPTSSITHSDFPPEKIHTIDKTLLPSPEQVMLLCKARRSNRAFSSRQIPEEYLNQILEAAHRAPTASNLQQIEFTLITNPDKLHRVTAYTVEMFSRLAKNLNNPMLKPILRMIIPNVYQSLPYFHRLKKAYDEGKDPILRGATGLILIHSPKESRFGCQDANLAYQNGSLMAESLGVNQFYTGFVCVAIKQDRHNKLAEELGIKGTIHAGMALGMPDFRFPNYIDKKEIRVTRIE